jgi:hypothetical protein
MDDEREKQYREMLIEKCSACFRKDECMLFSARLLGIENCIGPFRDYDDWDRKVEEDNRRGEEEDRKVRESGLRKLNRRRLIEEYRINKALCEELGTSEEQEDDD